MGLRLDQSNILRAVLVGLDELSNTSIEGSQLEFGSVLAKATSGAGRAIAVLSQSNGAARKLRRLAHVFGICPR
jgi:hypothetical protein